MTTKRFQVEKGENKGTKDDHVKTLPLAHTLRKDISNVGHCHWQVSEEETKKKGGQVKVPKVLTGEKMKDFLDYIHS